tara:strand:+ start:247 stop:537 length:291 start_codon:yes stop_codon:yes gene_type:complete
MKVREVMERTGIDNASLAIAWIKDAFQLIQSNSNNSSEVSYMSVRESSTKDDNIYIMPGNILQINNVSVKDTSDGRYKKIKRLITRPSYLMEDTSP